MPTMRVDAHELSKVKVEYISLVKRGANRLPIRILKGDTAVLDLDLYHQRQDRQRAVKADAVLKTSQAISDATLLLVQAGYKVIAASGTDDPRADDGHAIDADPMTADNGKNPAAGSTATDEPRLDDGAPNAFSPDTPSKNIAVTRTVANATGVSDAREPGDALGVAVPYQQQGSPIAKGDPGTKKPKKQPPGRPGADGLDAHQNFDEHAAADDDGDSTNGNPGTGGKVGASHGPAAPKKPVTSAAVAKARDQPERDPVEGTIVSDAQQGDIDDPENPATADDEEDSAEVNQSAVTKPSVVKSKTKKGDDDALAQLLAGMASMSANVSALAASVQKMDASVTAIDQKVEAVNARVAKTDKSLAALVPGQARNDHEVQVTKSDMTSFPLIDTGFKSRL